MLLRINGKFTIGKLKRRSEPPLTVSRGVGQSMKQTYLYMWYPLFQTQWDRSDQLIHQN
jgi:hypothetical protein